MKKHTLRRVAVAAIAPVLAAGTVLAAPAAQADANPHEQAVATWLAKQVGNVEDNPSLFTSFYEYQGLNAFIDYGLNLDLAVALDTFGEKEAADTVHDAVVAAADDYTDSGGTRYAGAMGKLASMVERHGDEPRTAVGDRDLIAETEGLVVESGDAAGRAIDEDVASGEEAEHETSNTIGQGWVVRALAGADSALVDETVGYLVKQQCDDGSFRLKMADTQCTTGGGSVDTTAFAIQALDVVDGNDEAVQKAIDWLVETQSANGSFQDEGVANTNSAGLAAVVLASHGETEAAWDAAGWVAAHQVASGDEQGVIALNDQDFTAASGALISQLDRDRYARASVQAGLSLSALLPAEELTVEATTGYVSGGKSVAVTATGLQPGETFTARISSAALVRGTADETGTVKASVPTLDRTARQPLTVRGSNSERVGKAKIAVLAGKALTPALTYTSVKAGYSQKVTVKGLAAGESVKVYQSNVLKKSGTATTSGTYTVIYKVGTSKGKKTVKVVGAFSDRTGRDTFRVR